MVLLGSLILSLALASGGMGPDDARAQIMERASRSGYTRGEARCLDRLIHAESRYRIDAKNPRSSAYGLFQLLKLKPGTPLAEQWERGDRYIKARYGTACKAWAHHKRYGWY